MRYRLTHYGHRYAQHLLRSGAIDAALADPAVRALATLFVEGLAEGEGRDDLARLAGEGMVEPVGDAVTVAETALRYARNPLEHLSRVVFELTTVCNLACAHCRNHGLEATHEPRPERLRRVLDVLHKAGVDRVDCIGGEVTLYARGWLDLVAYARSIGMTHASVITSGWFFGERDFVAAGRRYADDRAYLRALREAGLTHLVCSLDGPREVHDRWRGVEGLYDRVVEGFAKAQEAGLRPRVSLVLAPGLARGELLRWMDGLAERLHGPGEDHARLFRDDSHYVSNFIDVGGGVQLRRSRRATASVPDAELRCKNFFRPAPTFRVKASGEVSLCPLVEGGDGYGNVRECDVLDVLNGMSDAFVYRLHAEGRVAAYRDLLDPELFGDHLGHVCSMRVALTMLARAMDERGVSRDDREAVGALNREVAEKMGFAPRAMKNPALGHPRPGLRAG